MDEPLGARKGIDTTRHDPRSRKHALAIPGISNRARLEIDLTFLESCVS